ncbi:MarR family transcriptional regulator [Streptomyces avidinii]|uniref:MarR family transcriptional regulator n=1 Tax=Streptomyces avidinii TaxID=1895 RepID=UPI0037AFF56B
MKPIGYWLNRTDQALTASMNAALAEFGLTRLGWQVLNAVEDNPRAMDTDLPAALAIRAGSDDSTGSTGTTGRTGRTGRTGSEALTAAVEAQLAAGRLSRPGPGRLALTDDGRARIAEVGRRVEAFRELSAAGITHEEYVTAVSVLERMTHNLTGPRAGSPVRPGPAAGSASGPAGS